MNAWLIFPIRLLVVALLGVCLWTVLASTASQMHWAKAVTENFTTDSIEPYAWIGTTIDSGAALVIVVVGFALAVVTVWNFIGYHRFKRAVTTIESLGGSIRASPAVGSLWLHFFFCKSNVDLRHSKISDDCFPSFRHIPRLHSIRLSGTEPGEKVLDEIANCRTLNSLDVTNTPVNATDLKQFDLVSRVPSLLVD